MDFQLANGVNVHIIPTQQFKQTKVLVNFTTLQTRENAVVRNLLANLLVTSSEKYPTQTVLSRHLANLYGAAVSGYVTRIGHAHTLRLKATFVNEHFAPHVLTEMIATLGELIFHPLMVNDQFDPTTWQRQQANLVATLKSWEDDKQFYSVRQLEKLYYQTGSVMEIPSSGTLPQAEVVTNEATVAAYHQMLSEDQVDIFVIGDVDVDTVMASLRQLPFQPRESHLPATLFHHQPKEAFKELVEHQPIQQAHLNLAYTFPVYFGEPDYRPAIVMNGILGGTPYSKLFVNVREKASLAYTASSGLRAFSGHLIISAGIGADQVNQAEKLIKQQIVTLQNGDFDETTVAKVKAGLINQYYANQDDENYLLGRALARTILHQAQPSDYPTAIQAVTPAKIVDLAQQLEPAARYFLEGEN